MRIEKGIFAGIALLALSTTVSACPECRAKVESGIYNQDFTINFFVVLLPVLILMAMGFGLYYADEITGKIKGEITKWQRKENAVR